MNNEEAIKFIEPLTEFEGNEDYIRKAPMVSNIETVEALKMAIKALQNERPQGEWIITHHKDILGRWNSWYEYKCSVCKHSISQMYDDAYGEYDTKFCPNCGAGMQKGGIE